MSLKGQYTTADYLEWDVAMNLIRQLYRDGDYRMSVFWGCSCFLGLRYSDLSVLTWGQLLSSDTLSIIEKKTGKRRTIRINKGLQAHIKLCHDELGIIDDSQPYLLNRFGGIQSIQMVNRLLKDIKVKYHIKMGNISTHSGRKTFGRHIVEMAGPNAEMALIKLAELFNHVGSGTSVTRRYLGLRQEELGEVYDSLQF